nr:MAG TPA: hypothetical protein [Caudoviricetes sp.]
MIAITPVQYSYRVGKEATRFFNISFFERIRSIPRSLIPASDFFLSDTSKPTQYLLHKKSPATAGLGY